MAGQDSTRIKTGEVVKYRAVSIEMVTTMTHKDEDNLAWYFAELDRPDLDDLWPDEFYDEEGPYVQESEMSKDINKDL